MQVHPFWPVGQPLPVVDRQALPCCHTPAFAAVGIDPPHLWCGSLRYSMWGLPIKRSRSHVVAIALPCPEITQGGVSRAYCHSCNGNKRGNIEDAHLHEQFNDLLRSLDRCSCTCWPLNIKMSMTFSFSFCYT